MLTGLVTHSLIHMYINPMYPAGLQLHKCLLLFGASLRL